MIRVLCLHGSRQTGDIFEHQLNKLCTTLFGVAELDFVDAPCVLEGAMVEGDAVPTFSWSEAGGDDTTDKYAAGDAVVRRCMTLGGAPYSVILGFSQGALLAARYVMLQAMNGAGAYGPPLSGVIMAASPDPRRLFPELVASYEAHMCNEGVSTTGFFGAVPSLHIIGRRDAIVDPSESRSFAEACGPHSEVFFHDGAHSFPQRQSVSSTIKLFLERISCAGVMDGKEQNRGKKEEEDESVVEDEALFTAREEELEMVLSMYGEECLRRDGTQVAVLLPLLLDCAADGAVDDPLCALQLCMTLPTRYPAELPKLDVVGGPSFRHILFESWKLGLIAKTLAYLRDDLGVGNAMLLPAMMFASEQAAGEVEFLRSILHEKTALCAVDGSIAAQEPQQREEVAWWDVDEEQGDRKSLIAEAERCVQDRFPNICSFRTSSGHSASIVEAENGASRGGAVEFTVGLIGKPSAGKSTFFNAVTDPDAESRAARVAAFPFTTIEPNVSTGFGAVFCPCSIPQLSSSSVPCDALYGHILISGTPHRRHPVVIKDVAGLVQGAYKGKGKGNQFLNDLCDANVLVHVVDGAAATDTEGSACLPGLGSTFDDITWVREEVHSWIYDNLRAKWGGIRKKPTKLRNMFTGYRSSLLFVDGVLRHMGIMSEAELICRVPTWGPAELHLLVALYVYARFPIVLALNKTDMRAAATEVRSKLEQRYPHETFVSMSAKVECHLLQLRRKGFVRYVSGDSFFEETNETSAMGPLESKALTEVRQFFTSAKGVTTTGVQEVLAAALSRCPVVLVFPTMSLKLPLPSLKECFVFRSGTTAGEVFESLLYRDMLDGKLVRFEAVDVERLREGHEAAPLKKDVKLPGKYVVVRILTNKKQTNF